MYMNVYIDFICNPHKLKTTQMIFKPWMDKEIVIHTIQTPKKKKKIVVYLYNEILFNNKMEQLPILTTWMISNALS